MRKYIFFALLVFCFVSCQDKIDIHNRLNGGQIQLVVDAFLHGNDSVNVPTVKLTTSQYFYDNSAPAPATGAVVTLVDLTSSKSYPFSEAYPGIYRITPAFSPEPSKDTVLSLGHAYRLEIHYQGEDYAAHSEMKRVVPIDSIKFQHRKNAIGDEQKDYIAEFFATDPPGVGDRYWIRYYHNGVRDTSISYIGLGYDANAFPNGIADNEVFILPLRQGYINNLDHKWEDGDTIRVELFSITDSTTQFLSQLSTQSNIGQGGALGALFSPPIANIPTNIFNVNSNGKKAVGWFSVSAASSQSAVVPIDFRR